MAKYQVEVAETFYYYILVDTENEKEAKKLAISNHSHPPLDRSIG